MGRIFVIGGANIDICGASNEPLRNYDSNPGTVSVSFGGVGRNIAEYAALLGADVKFVTAFSHDHYGSLLRSDCEKLGIDCSYSITTEEYPTSMYIAILDHDRDMRIAMSDMRILRAFGDEMLERVLNNTAPDDIIIIDANLHLPSLHYIAANAGSILAADPVSVAKAGRLEDVLGRLRIFKPNRFEAEHLCGFAINSDQSMRDALDWFRSKGIQETVISMAERGVLLGTDEVKIHFTHRIAAVENATGGGDSFLAAYICARNEGEEPADAARFAIATALNVIEREETDRRKISRQLIIDSMRQAEIKERYL